MDEPLARALDVLMRYMLANVLNVVPWGMMYLTVGLILVGGNRLLSRKKP